MTTKTISTPAGDTIPARIVGQPPARPTRPLADPFTRQSGPAVRWSCGADLITAPISTPAVDTIPPRIVGQLPARPTRPLADAFTRQTGPAARWSYGAGFSLVAITKTWKTTNQTTKTRKITKTTNR